MGQLPEEKPRVSPTPSDKVNAKNFKKSIFGGFKKREAAQKSDHLSKKSCNTQLVDVNTRDVSIVKDHRVAQLMPR
jgi:hypothetical protein